MASLLAERYQLTEVVGAGGMGAVWSAWDTRLHRQVAVKVVPMGGLGVSERERVVREARATARLRHPNVVTLHDAGEAAGSIYLVMELVDGTTLADRVAMGPLGEPEAVRIVAAVLDGLGDAHAAGIVHRDIKPSNVLLGANGEVKLADFGIARRLDEVSGSLTATGQHLGTPKYFAPELLGGEPAGVASDLYAVGVVLFEALAGRPPFDKETTMATAMAHVNDPVPDVRSLAPATSPEVAAVVARALEKDPSRRFVSAREMRSALAVPSAGPPPRPVAPTAVMTTGPVGMRGGRWWLLAVVLAVVCGAIATLAVLNGGDDPSSKGVPTAGQGALSSPTPSTLAPSTTSSAVPTPAVATTIAAAATADPVAASGAVAPGDVDALIAVLAADPERYGSRTNDVVSRLGNLGNGRKATDRAVDLLESAEQWVTEGQLDASALDMLGTVLEPIADGPGNSDDDNDGDGDD